MKASLAAAAATLLLAFPAQGSRGVLSLRAQLAPFMDQCLVALVDRENDTWDPQRSNKKSGAYGLPQALPGSKMRSAGADWATNPVTQLRWLATYVRRWGGSCGALVHSRSYGWY